MMDGFFSKKEVESKSRPDGKLYTCISCGLYKNCDNPRFKPFGKFKKGILNVGGPVTKYEDQKGKPWIGSAGKLLEKTYQKFGIDLYEDCLNVHSISCYAPDSKIDLAYQVPCCRNRVVQTISEHQPKIIVLFGAQAISSVIGSQWSKDLNDVDRWRGWQIPIKDFKAWVCPVFHPSKMEEATKEMKTIWEQDIEQISKHVDIPFPRYKEPHIEYIEDLSVLDDIDVTLSAFDYETTGIKPHAKGHRIICASVSTGPDFAYSFLMPKTRKERAPFLRYLANSKIGKMAHNMKYEETWSVVRLNQPINNWAWDSMIAAHILDNRPGITGLKFQAFVNFGITEYTSEVDAYFKSGKKDGNALNEIEKMLETEEGIRQLLLYCGRDSAYEHLLALKQIDLIDYDFLPF